MGDGGVPIDNTPLVPSNIADTGYFGDALPNPVIITNVPMNELRAPSPKVTVSLLRQDPAPSWFPSTATLNDALFLAWRGDDDGSGTVTIPGPIVVPLTGSFVLWNQGYFRTETFLVIARQPAYVQCLDATTIAGASTQDPTPFRAKLGSCTMSRSGGDNMGKQIAQASCATSKGQSDCTYNATVRACTGAPLPLAQRRVPGDAVTVSWSGGDVPAGTASVVVPATVDLQMVPGSHSISEDLVVTFTGGSAGALLRMTLSQTTSGSLVFIDCDADAASGQVVLPKAFFSVLLQGNADLNFTTSGMKVVNADQWQVEVSAPGLVTKGGVLFNTALPLTLTP